MFMADGYYLTKDSPAIDHGVTSGIDSDIDGNPKPWGGGYALGAAENRATSPSCRLISDSSCQRTFSLR
jgi:hypothetical protein